MIRIVRWLVLLVLTLVVFAALDQALVRVPMKLPVLEQFQEFYVDFRGRLLGLVETQKKKPSIEQVIETTEKTAAVPEKESAPRYLYVDETGALQFANSLKEVPLKFRKEAKPMEY